MMVSSLRISRVLMGSLTEKRRTNVRDPYGLAKERSLVLIKPDGLMRGVVGLLLTRFENVGLKMVGLKLLQPTKERLDKHFPQSDEWLIGIGDKTMASYQEFGIDAKEALGTSDPRAIGLIVRDWNYDYLMMGPVIAIVFEGPRAVQAVRKLIGHTLPYKADPGTIRGDFSINTPDLANLVGSSCKNVVHASGTVDEAITEIECWFAPDELCEWERVDTFLMFLEGRNTAKRRTS
jgi:nucleoside-diphosphate kinase